VSRSNLARFTGIALVALLIPLARPGAGQPPQPANVPKAPAVEGTEWVAKDGDAVVTFRFEKGGGLAYTAGGKTLKDGTWKLDGADLTFETGGKARTCKAKVTGDKFDGESTTPDGTKWKTTAYRYAKPD
jgi:hypothetical protein